MLEIHLKQSPVTEFLIETKLPKTHRVLEELIVRLPFPGVSTSSLLGDDDGQLMIMYSASSTENITNTVNIL